MKVYIAGPISGPSQEAVDKNRTAFHKAAAILQAEYHTPLNPAHLPDGLSEADYMAICMPMLMVCDCILLLPGWETSTGARVERDMAEKIGMRIVHDWPRGVEFTRHLAAILREPLCQSAPQKPGD
ncbi:DUF4406 domain-containing protein [Aeromonas enteropelogenes]|uniref:DUF4406 domain-containing protein n=1 Tax=Aeromonas enteropelogenes TaxID=29489 RepID=UPI003B9F22D5